MTTILCLVALIAFMQMSVTYGGDPECSGIKMTIDISIKRFNKNLQIAKAGPLRSNSIAGSNIAIAIQEI